MHATCWEKPGDVFREEPRKRMIILAKVLKPKRRTTMTLWTSTRSPFPLGNNSCSKKGNATNASKPDTSQQSVPTNSSKAKKQPSRKSKTPPRRKKKGKPKKLHPHPTNRLPNKSGHVQLKTENDSWKPSPPRETVDQRIFRRLDLYGHNVSPSSTVSSEMNDTIYAPFSFSTVKQTTEEQALLDSRATHNFMDIQTMI